MADIEQELQNFKNARYGEEVRDSMVSAISKINEQVEDDTESAKAYAESAEASLEATNTAKDRVEGINSTLQSVVDNATQVMNDTTTAEALRVEAENARVEAEELREDTEKGYVNQAKEYMEQTRSYASSNYVTEAQSWATGGTNTRAGEDTNNAKYWASQAESIAGGNSVLSFNGRTGIVAPTSGDYTATQISYGESNVSQGLDNLASQLNTSDGILATLVQTVTSLQDEITTLKNKCPYEVGQYFYTDDATNPSTLYPGTTWEQITDRFLWAEGSSNPGYEGGSRTHTHRYGFRFPSYYGALHGESDDKAGALTGGDYNKPTKFGFAGSTEAASQSYAYINNGTSAGKTNRIVTHLYSTADTSEDNTLPPYRTAYLWKRTA